ncbi:hypothetical protein Dip510_001381 [Elusimicrobium posterum]|uniref:hypothetical protein n=1 Tax=Elusimicrobium posterum TaxID=3116653 RepID=UPI003C73BC63
MKYFLTSILILLISVHSGAAVFNSADGQFSMDMPAGWTQNKNTAEGVALSLSKGASKMEFRYQPECTKEACIEEKINSDLLDVKSKKMTVLSNTYTGEDIKKVEFATGEPLFYISFSNPKTDFSAGYFLINSKAYSVLAQNISYAEADLYFSFISPKVQSYSTYALPDVQQQDLLGTIPNPGTSTEIKTASEPQSAPIKAVVASKFSLEHIKSVLAKNRDFTFVSKNMPPLVRGAGRLFDAFIILCFVYLGVLFCGFVLKLFIKGKAPKYPANPASSYPISVSRLYGTPSVIMRAKDNQGNVFLSFNTRWGSALAFAGFMLIAAAFIFMAGLSVNETFSFQKMHQFHYSTAYSVSSLISAVGVFILMLGVIISLVSLREYTFYNKNGRKSIYVLQKGYGIKKEVYSIYYAHTKDSLTLERKKFSLTRKWTLFGVEGESLAVFTEQSKAKAVARKFLGHMWGMLRASYDIDGILESKGVIKNHQRAFNHATVNIDKPQAIDALDMLVAAAVINLRDADTFYPWMS